MLLVFVIESHQSRWHVCSYEMNIARTLLWFLPMGVEFTRYVAQRPTSSTARAKNAENSRVSGAVARKQSSSSVLQVLPVAGWL